MTNNQSAREGWQGVARPGRSMIVPGERDREPQSVAVTCRAASVATLTSHCVTLTSRRCRAKRRCIPPASRPAPRDAARHPRQCFLGDVTPPSLPVAAVPTCPQVYALLPVFPPACLPSDAAAATWLTLSLVIVFSRRRGISRPGEGFAISNPPMTGVVIVSPLLVCTPSSPRLGGDGSTRGNWARPCQRGRPAGCS